MKENTIAYICLSVIGVCVFLGVGLLALFCRNGIVTGLIDCYICLYDFIRACPRSSRQWCSGLRSDGDQGNDFGESGEVTEPGLSLDVDRLSHDHHRDGPPQPRDVIANAPPYEVIANVPPFHNNGIPDDVLNSDDASSLNYDDDYTAVDAYVDHNGRVHLIYRHRDYIDSHDALPRPVISDGSSTNSAIINSQELVDDALAENTADAPPTYSACIDSQAPTDGALSGNADDGLPTYSAYINSQAASDDANMTSTPLLEEDNPR